ncbi:DUF6787 family protein [Roseivirga sp. 4D4]|uniref:DUF6787 family protein n=1 Tax=Roseivirga sp. 4D4 TaxID=1889784 RepID=UPI0009F5AFB4|nr:DUF6787 family protein [Roseivirga sp. 4D4]
MEDKPYLKRLQAKWGLKSLFQTIMVLIVFAFTGSTVLFIKPFLFDLIGFDSIEGIAGILLYIVMIFPLYQILILIYGFIFGQFAFFWAWEKKMVQRMTGRARKDKAPKKS